jgi:DNA-binding NarL/FixJ family response regulator
VITVVVADDQTLVRHGLHLILDGEDDLDVVGEAADGREAVDLVGRLSPDVVLMDIRMPGLDGVAACRRLVAAGSPTRVLVLTTFGGDEYVYAALRAGASGFLLKTAPPEQLAAAIRTVVRGEALLDPQVLRRLIEGYVEQPPPGNGPPRTLAPLTGREVDVLREVGRGAANAEIAGSLHLSESTVKTYVGRILAKLGLRDRAQMVVTAYESGLIRPGGTSPRG